MTFKTLFVFALLATPLTSFASFTVNLPLENNTSGSGAAGGSLPSGSIVFSGSNGGPSIPPPPPIDPNNPTDPNEDPRMQACRDKQPQVISIVESYGQVFSGLNAYHDEEEDKVYCTADYTIPDEPQRSQVIQELNNIGVGTAM